MSDLGDTDRTVGAPPPRRTAASLLQSNRSATSEPTADSPDRYVAPPPVRPAPTQTRAVPEPSITEEIVVGERVSATVYESAPTAATVPTRKPRPLTVTFAIPQDLRTRARAMFRATAQVEGDDSFAGMLCSIIERECERREARYNAGERFTGGEQMLLPGRKITSS